MGAMAEHGNDFVHGGSGHNDVCDVDGGDDVIHCESPLNRLGISKL